MSFYGIKDESDSSVRPCSSRRNLGTSFSQSDLSDIAAVNENPNNLQGYWKNKQFPEDFPRTEIKMMEEDTEEQEEVTLKFKNGKTYKFPVVKAIAGPPCIDIKKLYEKTGHFTLDPGFMSTASCVSKITLIDSNKGKLWYRGYCIEELAEYSDFEEVTYLLLYGELPTAIEKQQHEFLVKKYRMIHEKLIQFYSGFHYDAHPMAIMVGVVGALSAFYHDSLDINNPRHRQLAAYRLLAKIPTIAAIAYKTSIGQPIVYPLERLNFIENFIHMMFAVPSEDFKIPPIVAKSLEMFFILHADHEQNASTSTVRIAGSSLANPFACISSGIVTLWGNAHGGASESVIIMLENIGSVENIPEFLEEVKQKKNQKRLMGFGHRIYKAYDPRAKIMKKMSHELLDELQSSDPLLEIAVELEKAALADEYFCKRKLFPNVDFYSGIVMRAIGIPISMFTVIFAVARTIGWISNWKEMIEDSDRRIGRPRQLYNGVISRKYVPIYKRHNQVDPFKMRADSFTENIRDFGTMESADFLEGPPDVEGIGMGPRMSKKAFR